MRSSGFLGNQRGTITILTAFAFVVLAGFAALAIDVASFYYIRRNLQAAADLAAMAAAADVGNAHAAATASAMQNAYPASAVTIVETGIYTPDPTVAIAKRFVPSAGAGANAARVSLQTRAPFYFGGILMAGTAHATTAAVDSVEEDGTIIEATAIATQPLYASFAIGSRLVKVDGGVLNAILGGLTGSSLSLSAVDYQSLIDTNIDLFKFSDALASRVSLTGTTYDGLVSSNLKAGDVFGAMVDAARADPSSNATAVNALARIADTQKNSSAKFNLNPLVDFGPFGNSPIGSKGLIGASVSALDLAMASAELANGTHQVAASLNLGLPGIASSQLLLTIGERPVGTSWVAIGSTGASVHTAQTRLYVKLQLLGSGPVAVVNLPLYVEVASGTATLDKLSCKPGGAGPSSVTLGVTPAVVDAWIGDITPAAMSNLTTAPSATATQLVSLLGIATVTGRAHATITNLSPTPVIFSDTDIASHAKKTTSTTDFVASLLGKLIGDLQLKVNVIGLGIGLPSNLTALTSSIISAAAPSIDQLLDQTLQTLGIGLGQADTWIGGVNCNRSVLVN